MKAVEEIKVKLANLEKMATDISEQANEVSNACSNIGRSWSGSSLVGHAKYFFGDFDEPATTQRFSIEWGLIHGVPKGWSEHSDDEVRAKIESDSGASLDVIKDMTIALESSFSDVQREAVLQLTESGVSEEDVEKIEKYQIRTSTDIFNDIFPRKFMTRDSAAMTGHYVTPHIYHDAFAQFIYHFPSELKGFLFELRQDC